MDTVLIVLTYGPCLVYLDAVIVGTPIQPADDVHQFVRSPPKAESSKMLRSEVSMASGLFCIIRGTNHRPKETEGHASVADKRKKLEIMSFLGSCAYYSLRSIGQWLKVQEITEA
jgi:hypothetical protein